MFEIFKELIHEPEKFKKYILFIVNILLTSIITSYFFENLYGKYDLILFSDTDFWKQIFNFIISGKVIIISFLFFIVKNGISKTIQLVLEYLNKKIVKFFDKENLKDNNLIREILSYNRVLKFDKNRRYVYPDKNFDEIYSFLENSNKTTLLNDINNYKKSLLFEMYLTFIYFTIVYYMFISLYKPFIFDLIIIIVWIIGTFFMLLLQYMSELINKNYDELIFNLKLVKQVDITDSFIRENKLKILDNSNDFMLKHKSIVFNNNIYFIHHYSNNNSYLKNLIDSYENNEQKAKILVLTSKNTPLEFYLKVKDYPQLNIIKFTSSEQLINDLENYFKQ